MEPYDSDDYDTGIQSSVPKDRRVGFFALPYPITLGHTKQLRRVRACRASPRQEKYNLEPYDSDDYDTGIHGSVLGHCRVQA